jgi:hypothetical protein
MKTVFRYLILAALCLTLGVSIAQAQPCVPSYPAEVHVGESHCIKVCPFFPVTFLLVGPVNGPQGVPVLILEAGCSQATTHCNSTCTNPILPPQSFIFGNPPFYPNDYFGTSDCLDIYYHWVHDGTWQIFIFSRCNGCFCLTYDQQLSVELLDFSAIAGNGTVDLHWSTASETDNDAFEIVRDGNVVSRIEAASEGADGHNYTWTDESVTNGRTYSYTLVSVDLMGHREELATESATPNSSNSVATDYSLSQNYPNPFNPETSIAFNLVNSGLTTLKVYTLTGQEVATLVNGDMASGSHTVNFNAGQLSSGVYLYTLTSGDFSATKKFMLLK